MGSVIVSEASQGTVTVNAGRVGSARPSRRSGGRRLAAGISKSHSKSQRRPSSGDISRHRATVCAAQLLSEPSRATPGDAREVTGGQGVAGSNPAVPTGSQTFSNILTPHQSQQKSHSPPKRPSQKHASAMSQGVPPAHLPNRPSQRSRPVKGSNIAEPPRPCTAPGNCRPDRTPTPAHQLRAAAARTWPGRRTQSSPPPASCSNRPGTIRPQPPATSRP
jgi:hypothetical protein